MYYIEALYLVVGLINALVSIHTALDAFGYCLIPHARPYSKVLAIVIGLAGLMLLYVTLMMAFGPKGPVYVSVGDGEVVQIG